ncbi:alkyl/aryl-sulfatase [Thiolapillus brandeum]|uniref:alkyl/aryl-sulfatase n=1 Tax=Thiolapillus brandeum TaxID=1076588 RepID=UPI000A69A782|nr:alkyl sulfatase dimerization domain-containing protein [Thiolapillus brandeum]
MNKKVSKNLLYGVLLAFSVVGQAGDQSRNAAPATEQANKEVLNLLPFEDKTDFERARRGLIAELPGGKIQVEGRKRPNWDLNPYAFLDGEAAATVNPSLWRMAQLNMANGLFKVTDHVYQVRGLDLANITFVEGETGWIAIDPLTTAETAKVAYDLLSEHVSKKPIHTVIYTHSHVDHYAGVRGIVSEQDVQAGKVQIIAPAGFLEHAVSENVIAGNAMSRRAQYMYGIFLEKGSRGQVDAGLGKGTAQGTPGLIAPTLTISETGKKMTIDGVEVVFQVTPGTEAPAEMNFYFPQFKALCMAENVTHTLHNLYTLRGAEVRNSKAWAHYINESIDMFAKDAEVEFASHHWPTWGNEQIVELLIKQRDLYKYLHDQTLNLANKGYTMLEIAEMIKLPKSLASEFSNRGYYGTVSHNVRAVYNKYLGYFDGNPAHLNPLPPEAAGKKYVEFMGGASEVTKKARKAYENGEYRWVAEVMSHVVFADPKNKEARALEADALEQLGYQAESGPWRNFYLMGAKELRTGVRKIPGAGSSASPDTAAAMTVDMYFDYLGVRLNAEKAEGKKMALNWVFTDTGEKYALTLSNSVLNYSRGKQLDEADATITMTRRALNPVLQETQTFQDLVDKGQAKLEGNNRSLNELMSMMDDFDLWFDVVLP